MANEDASGRTSECGGGFSPAESPGVGFDLVDHISDAVISTDAAFRLRSWNRAAERIYGWRAEEVLGQVAGEVLKAEFREEQREAVMAALMAQGSVEAEVTHRHRDGHELQVQARLSLIRNDQGEPCGTVGVLRDVTERRQAEAALRQSERRLMLAVESGKAGVWEYDLESEVNRWEKGMASLLGVAPAQAEEASQHWFRFVHPDDRERVTREFAELLEGTRRELRTEFRALHTDGSVRWLLSHAKRFEEEHGRRLVGFDQDITEQKQAAEALLRSEARLARGVEVAGLGLFEHDHRRDVIEWSPELRQMYGFGIEEPATIESLLALVVAEDRGAMAAAIRRAHDPAGQGQFEVEYRVRTRAGHLRWMSVRSQTYFEGQGAERHPVRTIGAVRDITERKAFLTELERLVDERTAKLQELVGELEHFSYTITHDMKSPLRAMKGFAEIANLTCEQTELKEYLARISTSAERMECLITDALSYSQSVRQELPLCDVDTGALLRGMLDSYPELQPSRAQIEVTGPLPVVLGNEAGLTQCFSNLLGNAVKFVRPGDKPQVRIWAEEREGWARIWVTDQGIGIARQMLPRVFDMFSRGSKKYEGTGIGLALVRKVTQHMGGKAGVESEEGKGSRFWIELKTATGRLQAERIQAALAEPKGGTVLYVEDEESDALFMKLAFAGKGLGSALRVVADGRAAVEYLSGAGAFGDRQEHPLPAVVVLDLNLPAMPGFEVLKWMRSHPDFARTPVVVFSSSTREDDRVKALALGANAFVGKPSSGLDFGDLLGMLQEKWHL